MNYPPIEYVDAEDYQSLNGWLNVSRREDAAVVEAGKDLVMLRTVINSTVKRVHELDTLPEELMLSPLRDPERCALGESYPMHAIIVVEDVSTARDTEIYLNKKFQAERARFPAAKGWRAMAVYGNGPLKFNEEHPFFHYKNSGRLSHNSCRFLVAVDLATEGMNNKFLGVMGLAKRARSVREVVQRLGRLVRSAHYSDGGQMLAPPVNHDRVHVITHEGYGNRETLDLAFAFLRNMRGYLQDMIDIAEYAEQGVDTVDDDEEYAAHLTFDDVMMISDEAGLAILTGRRLSYKRMLNRLSSRKQAKRELAISLARNLYDRNKDSLDLVRKTLFSETLPEPATDIIVDDKVRLSELDADQCKAWVVARGLDGLLNLYREGSTEWIAAVRQVNAAIDGSYRTTSWDLRQNCDAVLREFAAEVVTSSSLPRTMTAVAHRYITEAALDYLQCEGATQPDLEEGGRLNIPSVLQELRNPDWRMKVKRWAMWRLYENGYLKNQQALLDGLHHRAA